MPKKKKKIIKKRKNTSKKKVEKNVEKELIFKTRKDWLSKATVNKSQYEKKYKYHFRIMIVFGKKKEKELIGLSLIQKLKM